MHERGPGTTVSLQPVKCLEGRSRESARQALEQGYGGLTNVTCTVQITESGGDSRYAWLRDKRRRAGARDWAAPCAVE